MERAVGRRKTAAARVRISPGTGTVTVNNPSIRHIFDEILQQAVVARSSWLERTKRWMCRSESSAAASTGKQPCGMAWRERSSAGIRSEAGTEGRGF